MFSLHAVAQVELHVVAQIVEAELVIGAVGDIGGVGFAAFFVAQIFSEPHSTKLIEDGIGWFLDTDPETIVTAEYAPFLRPPAEWERSSPTEGDALPFLRRVACPVLVVHGTEDQIVGIRDARRAAETLGAPLVEVAGGGHAPIGRDPVLANLLIRDFVLGLETMS